MTEINEIIAQRDATYGGFENIAAFSQKWKRDWRREWVGESPTDVQAEAMDNMIEKVARIVKGDAAHKDSWVDGGGYLLLGAEGSDAVVEMPPQQMQGIVESKPSWNGVMVCLVCLEHEVACKCTGKRVNMQMCVRCRLWKPAETMPPEKYRHCADCADEYEHDEGRLRWELSRHMRQAGVNIVAVARICNIPLGETDAWFNGLRADEQDALKAAIDKGYSWDK